MGNNPSSGNNTGQQFQTPSQISNKKAEIIKAVQQECYRKSVNSTITFESYSDILGIFSDYGTIHLRKTPIAYKVFKSLDANNNNRIDTEIMIKQFTNLVNSSTDEAIQCILTRFFYVDFKESTLFEKRQNDEIFKSMFLCSVQKFIQYIRENETKQLVWYKFINDRELLYQQSKWIFINHGIIF